MEFTTVLGVDEGHLEQFLTSFPTWAEHKPEILMNPMVIFWNGKVIKPISELVRQYKRQANSRAMTNYVSWPPPGVQYIGSDENRFMNEQRYRMLSGFVHVPAQYVETQYWLKLDLDVIATGQPDWIDSDWFEHSPAIVGHPWGYTKPPDQMLRLDDWVGQNALPGLSEHPSLDLVPCHESSIVRHQRIISWCAFFETEFTRSCSHWAKSTCGEGQLPVPSQDGFMWYCAARSGRSVVRTGMKSRGWEHCSCLRKMREAIANGKRQSP